MKTNLFLFAIITVVLFFISSPIIAQSYYPDTTATEVHKAQIAEENYKVETQLNKDRTNDAKAINKEFKAKAKEAKRIERDAANASQQAAKAVRLERKAQEARQKADKQKEKAQKAAEKSDNNY